MIKSILFAAAFCAGVALSAQTAAPAAAPGAGKATASSSEKDQFKPEFAIDGKLGTRWSSKFSDDQWLCLDLGSAKTITGAKLNWEGAYGKEYKLQVSDDGQNWTDAFVQKDGKGKKEEIKFDAPRTGRYFRLLGIKRGTKYGDSLLEIQVRTK